MRQDTHLIVEKPIWDRGERALSWRDQLVLDLRYHARREEMFLLDAWQRLGWIWAICKARFAGSDQALAARLRDLAYRLI